MLSVIGFAQVGINTDGSDPDPSAVLDVKSTSKGLLLPRLTIEERDAITDPAAGLVIYCKDAMEVQFFNGVSWVNMDGSKPIPYMSGSLEDYLLDFYSTIPGSSGDNFVAPTTCQLSNWGSAVNGILQNNPGFAQSIANTFNYRVIKYKDTVPEPDQLYYILEEKTPLKNYWGIYVFNPSPCRKNLVLQAPHPKYDYNTGKQTIYCYTRLDAKAFCMSGAHRCNNSSESVCDGTSSVCTGSSAPYKISDNAHNTNSVFQETTQQIFYTDTNTIFVQLHGFTKQDTDPYVIMSNGTRNTPAVDYVVQIKDSLEVIDPVLTFKIAHIDTGWNKLVAFTNVQGRMLNESSDPCSQGVSDTGPGANFMHIEQEKIRLREDSTKWNKMYQALEQVFQCSP